MTQMRAAAMDGAYDMARLSPIASVGTKFVRVAKR